jgi:hypothetical protein
MGIIIINEDKIFNTFVHLLSYSSSQHSSQL